MKDKQIKEMEKIIQKRDDEAMYASIAHSLYDAGYRKSTDVAEEIFAEIEKALDNSVETEHFKGSWFNMNKFMQSLAELKKKYTERENNNE